MFNYSLRVTKFNNGEEIPTGLSSQEWLSTRQPAYAEIIPNPVVGAVFSKGLQYNGYAAGQRVRLCPIGWTVASYSDWQKLIDYLGGATIAGGKLMSVTGYVQPGIPGPIENPSYNSSGFSALPSAGFMNNGGGISPSFGGYSDWWSPVDSGPEVVDNFRRGVSFLDGQINTTGQTKTFGYCVRCIQN